MADRNRFAQWNNVAQLKDAYEADVLIAQDEMPEQDEDYSYLINIIEADYFERLSQLQG